MNNYADGVYKARILDYGIMTTSKGDPKVFVEFQVKDDMGGVGRLTWSSGFYSSQGSEITLGNLMTLGLQSAQSVPQMADGLESKALDASQTYEVTIKNAPHWKHPDRTVPEIKYINKEGTSSKDANRMSRELAASKLASLNLGASFANVKAKQAGSGFPEYPDPSKIPF